MAVKWHMTWKASASSDTWGLGQIRGNMLETHNTIVAFWGLCQGPLFREHTGALDPEVTLPTPMKA